jgi:hypothetical protein
MNNQFTKDALNPNDFGGGICKCLVFNLCARMRHRGLFTRTPSDQVRTKKDSKAPSRPAIINIAYPISIREGTQEEGCDATDFETKTTRTT